MNRHDHDHPHDDHEHHPGCGCSALHVACWIAPAFGRLEPFILLAPASMSAVPDMTKAIDATGLRRGVLTEAVGAVAHLQQRGVALTCGGGWIGPIPAAADRLVLAHQHGRIILLIGTALVPEDMKGKEYLMRHGDDLVAGLVPVAGAVPHAGPDGKCGVIVAPVPLRSAWPLRTAGQQSSGC